MVPSLSAHSSYSKTVRMMSIQMLHGVPVKFSVPPHSAFLSISTASFRTSKATLGPCWSSHGSLIPRGLISNSLFCQMRPFLVFIHSHMFQFNIYTQNTCHRDLLHCTLSRQHKTVTDYHQTAPPSMAI